MGKTSWGDVQKGGESSFLKLEVGDTTLRVISKEPYKELVHFVGEGENVKRISCLGAGCPVCALGQGPTLRYAAVIFDRKNKAVKVLEQGKSVFGALKDYAESEKWGDLRHYDVTIKRQGKGKNDTKYSVMPCPKKALTKDEIAFIKQNMIVLDDVYKKMSKKEVEKLLGNAKMQAEGVEPDDSFDVDVDELG